MNLKSVADRFIAQSPYVKEYTERCLRTERWGGNVLLMVVDAGFTSIGLNYFTSVVPKVALFERSFCKFRSRSSMEDFFNIREDELFKIWKNKRSWWVVREVLKFLVSQKKENLSDTQIFRKWARGADLKNWKQDPIGKIKGVGITTFQYLRMMGGVDTVMPDKIVKRVITQILKESKTPLSFKNDIEFVELVHWIARKTGYRPIELTWMTWLVQREGNQIRSIKYAELLPKI